MSGRLSTLWNVGRMALVALLICSRSETGSGEQASASLTKGDPRLSWGGSQRLTIPGVHRGNSKT
jgi:hypothetical protein